MPKESFSWSKPDNIPNLIGRKQVDWTTFVSGSRIPLSFSEDFVAANAGVDLAPGEKRQIVITVNGQEYYAWLFKHPERKSYEISWDSPEFRKLLRERLSRSFQYLNELRSQVKNFRGVKNALTGPAPEFIEFYATGEPFRYRVELISTPGGAGLTGFDRIWQDIGSIIGTGAIIKTLAQRRPNRVEWTDEGVFVTTERGTDFLSRDMVHSAWMALEQKHIITETDLLEPARYRSAALFALLSLLPDVDYTTYPRVSLFLVNHEFSNDQISETFKVGTMRGIRYAVTAEKPALAVFVTGTGDNTEADHPYQDRWEEDTLLYTGEGLEGDQTLTAGNLALRRNRELDFPLYGFQKLAPHRYRYLGRFRVEEVIEEEQPDKHGQPRRVYVFRMRRAGKPTSVSEVDLPPPGNEVGETPQQTTGTQQAQGTRRPEPTPRPDLAAIAIEFAAALRQSHVVFGAHHDQLVRAFVAALATRPFVILTGLSGAGKTQIALRFGDWIGADRRLVVPVRPDWTGPEYLLGYPDALLKPSEDGRRAWHVPNVLAFLLKAHRDPNHPYLLVLDEMNLAHVERYFADVLSGMESGEPCLPNLVREGDGVWRPVPNGPEKVPFPRNVYIVGTVNVDETTYMFSPKVLDRASTFEFRVATDDLAQDAEKPIPCAAGDPGLVAGFLAITLDERWHLEHPAPYRDELAQYLRTLHTLLGETGFEFGHRVFYEAVRFAAMLAAAGEDQVEVALDRLVLQKVLPRLHGTRRRLEPVLSALGQFCFTLSPDPQVRFDPENPPAGNPRLPLSFDKVRRMTRSLRANQFAGFAEP